MLHAQDSHAMEPHSCHRFPTANDETDRPELKLVPFVTPTAAGKGHGRRKKSGTFRFFLTPACFCDHLEGRRRISLPAEK